MVFMILAALFAYGVGFCAFTAGHAAGELAERKRIVEKIREVEK